MKKISLLFALGLIVASIGRIGINRVNNKGVSDVDLSTFSKEENLKESESFEEISPISGSVLESSALNLEENEVKNEKGELLVPFYEAYPEYMDNIEYDNDSILVKTYDNEAKTLSAAFQSYVDGCSFVSVSDAENEISWYKFHLTKNVRSVINNLKKDSRVLGVDLNYLSRNEDATSSDSYDVINHFRHNKEIEGQEYLNSYGINETYKYLEENGYPQGGKGVTVAVIDTGVDLNHEDLKDNLWTNVNEIPGNGIDDDGNGYIDDVNGYNFVSDTLQVTPQDDQGHGTHVAGIIAASNNNTGVLGVAYNAKIMALKAADATGVFTDDRIAKAITYAYMNGADVINMSFGGSAKSLAVQDALISAYTTCVLVASAGNNGLPNESYPGKPANLNVLPSYPAALSYVIGVTSVNEFGVESSFSNFDGIGYTEYEYEVAALGEGVLSTLPNNRYGRLSGTSMSAPIISGMAALLRARYDDLNKYPSKFIMGQLAGTGLVSSTCADVEKHGSHNLTKIANAYLAMTTMPKPDVNLLTTYAFDDEEYSEANNGDGKLDAGETIYLAPVLINRWGMSKNTVITLDDYGGVTGDMPSPYVDSIENVKIDFEGVGTYSTKSYLTLSDDNTSFNPPDASHAFIVKISDDAPNEVYLTLNVTINYQNALDDSDFELYSSSGTISFKINRGVDLPYSITEDTTLTKDKFYILDHTLTIAEGVTLNIEAGTNIQLYKSSDSDVYKTNKRVAFYVLGTLNINGTQDEMVMIKPCEEYKYYGFYVDIPSNSNGLVDIKYAYIKNLLVYNYNGNAALLVEHSEIAANEYSYIYYFEASGELTRSSELWCGIYRESKISYYKHLWYVNAYNCVIDSVSGVYSDSSEFYFCTFKNYNDSVYYDFSESMPKLIKNIGTIGEENAYLIYGMGKEELSLLAEDFDINSLGEFANSADDFSNIESKINYDDSTYNLYNVTRKTQNEGLRNEYDEYRFDDIKNGKNIQNYNCYKYSNRFNDVTDEELILNDDYLKAKEYYEYEMDQFGIVLSLSSYFMYDYRAIIVKSEKSENEVRLAITNFLATYCDKNASQSFAILNNFEKTSTKVYMPNTNYYGSTINAEGLYIGTTNEEIIENTIVDGKDDPSNYLVDYDANKDPEWLSELWPFAKKIVLSDASGNVKNIFSNEEMNVKIIFNREMDMDTPIRVRFGSMSPYADYEISGDFVDSLTWVGKYKIDTIIENGTQYFRIEGGAAKDDAFLDIQDAPGRYKFIIDTTVAQAMMISASPTDKGIELTWFQNDYETLMGYNVYRSETQGGKATKLNTTVIPTDTTEFIDTEVEPGKLYYYTFTCVFSDFSESEAAGRTSCTAKDTIAPTIIHTPTYQGYTNDNLMIYCTAVDNVSVNSVTLKYRIKGETEYKSLTMNKSNDKYSAKIPSSDVTTKGIEYYIEVFDGVNTTYKGSADNPYSIVIKDNSSIENKGDVDLDGEITVNDALKIMKHFTGDAPIVDEDTFNRADINNDGELNSIDALAILQYINGTITSLNL